MLTIFCSVGCNYKSVSEYPGSSNTAVWTVCVVTMPNLWADQCNQVACSTLHFKFDNGLGKKSDSNFES